jgi:hypothetical protein
VSATPPAANGTTIFVVPVGCDHAPWPADVTKLIASATVQAGIFMAPSPGTGRIDAAQLAP